MIDGIPYSEQAEKWTLSAFMNDAALLAAHPLDPEAFHLPTHRTIYRRMLATGQTDAVILGDEMNVHGEADCIPALGGLLGYAVGPHLDRQIAVVRDCHNRRKAIEHAREIVEASNDRSDPDRYQAALAKASEVASTEGPPTASQRLADIARKSAVRMADYETMEPHQARSLLPRAIWRDILREGCLAILGGESKAKKSWFSLSFAMHAVTEIPFLGIPIETAEEPRRAVVLDYELMEGNVMSRFLALSEKFEGDAEAMHAIWHQVEIRCHRQIVAEEVDWIGYCCAVIEQSSRGDIVIVDCLQALPTGDVNDPREVRRVLGRLQAAATASGACVIVVDHFNKSGEARGKNRLSGSMAKAATPDAILLLESDGRDFITFTTELRMDLPRDPMTLEFRTASEGFRVVDSEEREDRKEAAKGKRDSERLAAMFPEIGRAYTKQEVADNIGKTAKTAENWIKEFPDAITIKEGSGKNPHLYTRNL